MTTLAIEGIGNVEVDDSFASMSPEQQSATVDEISASLRSAKAESDIVGRSDLFPIAKTGGGEIVPALPGFIEGPRKTAVDLLEGKKLAQDVTGREVAELGLIASPGSAATGVARNLAKGIGREVPTTKMVPELPQGQEITEAAKRLGIDLPRAAASDSASVQQAGKIISNVPVGGTPLRKASQTAIDQLGKAADEVQGSLGSGSIPSAGGQARAGIETQITERTAGRIQARYDKVDSLVDETALAPLTATRKVVGEIIARRGDAAISGEGQAAKLLQEAISRDGLSYSGTKSLRTFVGQLLDNPSALPVNLQKAELKQIYGSLTDDLRSVVSVAGGPEARRAFEAANSFAARQSGINKQLNTLLKAKSNEATFDKIVSMAGSTSRADISLLSRARGALDPKTWNEVSSAVISRLGRDADGNFTPDRFLTAYGKLSKQGKRVLFDSTKTGKVSSALDDIATVSRRFKEMNQFANPSGTGQTVLGGAFGVGLITEPLTALTSIVGARAAAEFLAKPATARPMAKWVSEYARSVAIRGSKEGLNRASRVLSVRIADEIGQPSLAPMIEEKLQTHPTPTQDQQQQ